VMAIHNPVVTPELFSRAEQPADHPWFSGLEGTGVPVILGMGRLTKQKDFHTLIRAFAEVRRNRNCRLMILGDGSDLGSLKKLVQGLGLAREVDFPGFHINPFPFLSRADLFVLSSIWEGFGMVLVEAMALGVPVVSTDCPSGPREILRGGQLGRLVPVGDHLSLAEAMVKTMDNPLSSHILIAASKDYTIEKVAKDYLETLSARQSAGKPRHAAGP
ncbi:MAG: glycosyltransferase, partial [Thermovirgaceae bacterium]|nr:glycosyltransferase [Thermovirgaceae bacterium]